MQFHIVPCMPSGPPAHFTKSASVEAARARLRTEAAVLGRARHPGIVAVIDLVETDTRTELVLMHDGPHTLATAPPVDARRAADCAAALAGILADLHEMGLVHHRLTADHVLVRADGRPVLCGLADAGPGHTEVDLRALGALFELLAESVPQPRTGRDTRLVRGLIALADQARTGHPPPSAAVLAHMAGALSGHSRVGRGATTPPRRARPLVFAVTVVTAAGVAAIAAWPRPHPAIDASAQPATTAPTTTARALSSSSTTAGPMPPRAAARIEAGGAVYEVGRAGDQVVIGDWDCDGEPGAALLRPDTGEIFVFDLLATPDHAVTGRALAQLPDAASLDTVDQTDGCTSLTVRLDDGSPRVLLGGAR